MPHTIGIVGESAHRYADEIASGVARLHAAHILTGQVSVISNKPRQMPTLFGAGRNWQWSAELLLSRDCDIVVVINTGRTYDDAACRYLDRLCEHRSVVVIWTPPDITDTIPDAEQQELRCNVVPVAGDVAALLQAFLYVLPDFCVHRSKTAELESQI